MKANDDFCGKQQSNGCTYYFLGCTAHLDNRSRPKKQAKSKKRLSGPTARTWIVHELHTLSTYKVCDNRDEDKRKSSKRAQGERFKADTADWAINFRKAVQDAKHKLLETGVSTKVAETGKPEPKPIEYQSMWDEPLVSAGDTLDTFGSIALHISIGIENDCFDLFERTIRELEAKLKAWCAAARLSGGDTTDIKPGLSQEIIASGWCRR